MIITEKEKKIKRDCTYNYKFEKGEHEGEIYAGDIYTCGNVLCSCSDIDIDMILIGNNNSDIRYSFKLDLIERSYIRKNRQNEKINENFAKSFINDLNENDWSTLHSLFKMKKEEDMEKCNFDELEAVFPRREIEEEFEMVGYHQILPFSKDLFININNNSFFINDVYCLNSKCNCTHSVLTFYKYEKPKKRVKRHYIDDSAASVIQYDYKKREWEHFKDNQKTNDNKLIKELLDETFKTFTNFDDLLKKRHLTLKALYKRYRKENPVNMYSNTGKYSKNQRCPCGSGKKYKRCCGKNEFD